jgi:hypothetical protein
MSSGILLLLFVEWQQQVSTVQVIKQAYPALNNAQNLL